MLTLHRDESSCRLSAEFCENGSTFRFDTTLSISI